MSQEGEDVAHNAAVLIGSEADPHHEENLLHREEGEHESSEEELPHPKRLETDPEEAVLHARPLTKSIKTPVTTPHHTPYSTPKGVRRSMNLSKHLNRTTGYSIVDEEPEFEPELKKEAIVSAGGKERLDDISLDAEPERKEEEKVEKKEKKREEFPHMDIEDLPPSMTSSIQELWTSTAGLGWRRTVHLTLEDPLSSKLATVIAVIINLLVLLSILMVALYPPNFDPRHSSKLDSVEIFVSITLTLDYLARLITAPKVLRWFIHRENFIDLISLLPFYIEKFTEAEVTGLQLIRFVRLLRILRMIRILRLRKYYRRLYRRKFRIKKKYKKVKYVIANILEQVNAVVPITLYVILFQYIVMGVVMDRIGQIVGGQLLVMGGLFLFIEGIKHGLVPLGDMIGEGVPQKVSTIKLAIISFFTGIVVTFAEPAVVSLTVVGRYIPVEKAPHLYTILENWSFIMLLFVGIGVGIASVLGVMKYNYEWSMKKLIHISVWLNVALTCVIEFGIPRLKGLAGFAWDCAAVTTGPVTVPIVLALGVGVADYRSHNDPSRHNQGFGIVTLASLYPVMCVEILGLISLVYSDEEIIQAAEGKESTADITEITPYHELINGGRAIIPLMIFLFILMKLVLKAKLYDTLLDEEKREFQMEELQSKNGANSSTASPNLEPIIPFDKRPKWKIYGYWVGGLCSALFGIIAFNFGITFGLAELGQQAGVILPGCFTHVDHVAGSPTYSYGTGLFIIMFFSWILGYLVTMAEPALHEMGEQVEKYGLMTKRSLVFAVSAGVGTGCTIGVILVIYKVTLTWVLIGGYLLASIMTHFSDDFLVNVAWDSAAVTTGDVTVPFVLVLGVNLAQAVGSIGGFGILAMASLLPIHTVLLGGFYTRFLNWYKTRSDEAKSKQIIAQKKERSLSKL